MDHAIFSGNLFTGVQVKAELIRARNREMSWLGGVDFCLETPRPYCQV